MFDAILRGNLTELGEDSDGDTEVSKYGFIYSTNLSNQNSLILEADGVEKTNLGSTSNVGEFSNRLIGLSEGTTYFYRAYAGNDIGTNLGEIKSFTTELLHATFALIGATDGEQSGIIYPSGTHTYNIPLSNTHSYNLTVDAHSNVLDDFAIYESTNTNRLYIQAGPFSITLTEGGVDSVTITFSGAGSGRRYLVLPLLTTNYRLVLSNSNTVVESYTLNLAKETGTAEQPVGRLLIDETPMGFFTNNDPELYWMHFPPGSSNLEIAASAFAPGAIICGVATVGETEFPANINDYTLLTSKVNEYNLVRILNNNGNIDYRKCQLKFRTR